MKLHEKGSIGNMANYRIETAKRDLKSAAILMREEEYRGANNRAYYAIYHAVSAVFALDGKSYKRHKDTLANFNKDYIKTEIFPKNFVRKIAQAEEIRHAGDYDDFYIATKEKAEEQIMAAKEMIEQIEAYCQKRWIIYYNKEGSDIMATTNITMRMEAGLKAQLQDLMSDLGLDMTTFFTMAAKQAIREQRIPFEVPRAVPNAETIEAIGEVRIMKQNPPIGKSYTDVDQMMKELLS